MRRAALALGLALTGCAAPVASRAPAPGHAPARVADAASPRRDPAPTVMWLRPGDQRFTGPEERGSILGRSREPALVELLADGSVRAVEGDLQGRLPPEARSWPTADRGLGLFVQAHADLHLGAPDGPVVGRALPGAYLPVIEPGPRTTEIALPGYQIAIDNRWRPVRAFVDSRSLGTRELPLPPSPDAADFRDHARDLSVVPGGPTFAQTLCGPLRVVEERDGLPRIAQHRAGVEVMGWARVGFERRRGDLACPPRVVERRWSMDEAAPQPELPEGYVAADSTLGDPLGERVRRGGRIFWLEEEGFDGLACTDWRIQAERGASDRVRLSSSFIDDSGDANLVVSSFIFEYAAADSVHLPSVVLLGPQTEVRANRGRGPVRSSMSMGCGEIYTIVSADPERVRVVRGQYLFGLVGYHPEDAETWYLDRRACESAAARPIASANQAHGGC
ncbi:MAG: hypothetical protein HYY06_13225 [Deltaproteobacteria bacterium]|nr:hypothetical protein [Deltaproteobacteria bacterium]